MNLVPRFRFWAATAKHITNTKTNRKGMSKNELTILSAVNSCLPAGRFISFVSRQKKKNPINHHHHHHHHAFLIQF